MKHTVPLDLYNLVKIPDEDIKSGRHGCAKCWGYYGEEGCSEPIKYRMTVEEWPVGYYNTAYYCEKHKPESEVKQ